MIYDVHFVLPYSVVTVSIDTNSEDEDAIIDEASSLVALDGLNVDKARVEVEESFLNG